MIAFIIAFLLAGLAVGLAFAFRAGIFEWTGGQLGEGGIPEPTSGSLSGSFWAYKLLYQGPIPYLIVGLIILSMIYAVLIVLRGLVPIWLSERNDISNLKDTISKENVEAHDSLLRFAEKRLQSGGRLMARLKMLERIYRLAGRREDVRKANDRMSASEVEGVRYALRPLTYAEWMLPVLGFIGTVWGVTGAVGGLREGINALFQAQQLTEQVRVQFMNGFRGLALAFDTTLFGLLGLATVGTVAFALRKSGAYVLLSIDKWANEAVNLLRERQPLEELIKVGFFETNEQGELERDKDGKPVLRTRKTLRNMYKQLVKGLFETDRQGQPIADGQGRPVLRWQSWMDMILAEFFQIDEQGRPICFEGTNVPVSKSGIWRRRLMQMLVGEFYELSEEEAEEVARGVLADTEEEVPLRSRTERRHREVVGLMGYVANLMHRFQPGAGGQGDGEGDEGGGRRRAPGGAMRVLEPSGTPVDAIALDDVKFAVAREERADSWVFELCGGSLQSGVGTDLVPVIEYRSQTPGRVDGLSLHKERMAYTCNEHGTVYAGMENEYSLPAEYIADGELVRDGVGLMRVDGVIHALFPVNGRGGSELLLWPVQEEPPAPRSVAPLPGTPVAFAASTARNSHLTACAVHTPEGDALLVVDENGEAVRIPLPDETAFARIAFGPGGKLWGVTVDGRLYELDGSAKKLKNRGDVPDLDPSEDVLLAVMEGEVILVGERGGDHIVAVSPAPGTAQRLEFPRSVTAVGTSPDGAVALVGLEDGSVYCVNELA
jgi:hypothetical protein